MRCSCGSRIRAKQVNGRWYWCCCRHDEKGDCTIKPVPEAQTDEAFCRLFYKLKHQSLPILEQMIETLRFRLHNGLELRESIERTVR